MASFWKPEACGQTVLPDRSVLIGQKLVENAKIKKCDILSNFQTLCAWGKIDNEFLFCNEEILIRSANSSQRWKMQKLWIFEA